MARCPKSTFGHQYKLVDTTTDRRGGEIIFVFHYECVHCGDTYTSRE